MEVLYTPPGPWGNTGKTRREIETGRGYRQRFGGDGYICYNARLSISIESRDLLNGTTM